MDNSKRKKWNKIKKTKIKLSSFDRVLKFILIFQGVWFILTRSYPNSVFWNEGFFSSLRAICLEGEAFLQSLLWPHNAQDQTYRAVIAEIVMGLEQIPLLGLCVSNIWYMPSLLFGIKLIYAALYWVIVHLYNGFCDFANKHIAAPRAPQAKKQTEKAVSSGLLPSLQHSANLALHVRQEANHPDFPNICGIRVQRHLRSQCRSGSLQDEILPWNADHTLDITIPLPEPSSQGKTFHFSLKDGRCYLQADPSLMELEEDIPYPFDKLSKNNAKNATIVTFTWVK